MQMYSPGEITGFCLKSCYLRSLSNLLYERNAITRAGFAVWHSARGPAQMIRLFLVFTYIRQEDLHKNLQSARGPHNVNPARAVTWLVGLIMYSTIFQEQLTSTWPV